MRPAMVGFSLIIFLGFFLVFFGNTAGENGWWPTGIWEEKPQRVSTTVGFLILTVAILSKLSVAEFKSRSPVIVTGNEKFHYNPDDGVYNAGSWEIRRTGGFNALGLSITGRTGCIAYPKAARRSWGLNQLILGDTKHIGFRKLPKEVQDCIQNRDIPVPCRIVYAPKYVETHGRDFTRSLRMLAVKSAHDSHVETIYDRSLRASDKVNRKQARQIERLTGSGPKSWLATLFSNENAKDDDDQRVGDDRDR